LANAVNVNADTFSSNVTKPFQLVRAVYNVVGNAPAMGKTYAGLPNMSALVHCRLRRELIKVANHPYNQHHSSHYAKIGGLQIRSQSTCL
jgi:hypothetical protein